MTKVKPSNENKTKSDIFQWDIFKSDTKSFFDKNIKVFQWLSKSKLLSFMITLKPNNGNVAKSDISPWDIFIFDTIFHWSKIT